ncbi:hypothetical protein ENSA5_61400 [Enhygromyxa salina]|uniref:YicC family protein n=1 Tax=Enhygromyxa salina TaxID=215803 RepID=A0A2S9XDH6_9BACT|nr:DUF1732 domain-containing protein [Enhygromyxa salina]PRP90820.1 hypothetical protein ENSA5_61400 [Enhygromyxa salina]
MPIHSMTGFGVAERAWPERGVRVHVELRSVNARYLELKLRQPFGVAVEHGLRRSLGAQLGRGRVDLAIRVEGHGEVAEDPLAALGVDPSKVASALQALSSLTAEAAHAKFELQQPNTLELLRFLMGSGAGAGAASDRGLDPPEFLDELVGEALTRLIGMRRAEGDSLAATLAELYDELEAEVARVEHSLGGESERLMELLIPRCEAVLAQVDGGAIERDRLTREIALLVVRGDVSEELARIASHLDQARAVLVADPEVGQGKTLDFLSQELLREVTTIGSKITSHVGSAVLIEAKRTVERIREQVQNVE